MIETCIEDGLFIFGSPFHLDAGQILVPTLAGLRTNLIKGECTHLLLQILTRIFDADVRDTHLHFDGFPLFGVVVEPYSHIITTHLAGIALIQFVGTRVDVPLSFHPLHRTLFFPISHLFRSFADTHHEIDRKDCLRIVAEGTHQFASLNLAFVHDSYRGTGLVGQALTQVQQDVALPFGEGKAA